MKVLEIVTADKAGFCFGVRRALDMAVEAAREYDSLPVFTLGPIIHNPQVVAKLEKLGVKVIERLENVDRGVLIIRSHGIAPALMDKARKQGLHIIDATCPYVKNAQKYAAQLVEDGYQTFIYGDFNHPEVKGIYGATGNRGIIINSAAHMRKNGIEKRVGFVAQTTKSPASYKKIIATAVPYCDELKLFNTICNTTVKRQSAASSLAQKVELMLVIGGFNSANTKRLAEICQATGTPTYHIETVEDVDWCWFRGKEKVGITAGASTPDWLIKEVIQVMSEEKKELQKEELEENVEEMEETEEVETAEEVAVEAAETEE
ncbi:MAG: 4-hydroxy-3-methylbut-2-enyl diphosphate reductase, partial [Halanaerobiaceae bacterium]